MRPAIPRRRLLGALGGAAALAAVGTQIPRLAAAVQTGELLRSLLPLPAPYRVPLPVPPVLTPHQDATTDYYEVTQKAATQEILPGHTTAIWGYEGIFPGPTLVSRSGRRTVVRHRNALPVPAVVHLHGGHTPSASDGYPTDLIVPDGFTGPLPHHDHRASLAHGSRVYEYPFQQRAATLWYHDHRMDFTGASVWRGLAGFHLVHDDEEEALPLPRGDRDIPLMITDRAFDADGSFRYPATDPTLLHTPGVQPDYVEGVLGDVILVNGAPWPVLEVDAARYRLRILNASNARRYRLELDPQPAGGGALVQIGSDGGLLAAPRAHDAIVLAPAERFDVVVDFSRYRVGDEVTLVNRLGSGTTAAVMRFRIARRATDDSAVPARLSGIERLDPARATATRTFAFRDQGDEGWTINGRPYDPMRADATPRLGALEVWQFTSDFHHPVHLHLSHFQVLSRNGEGPGPYDAGWKDTVDLSPGEAVAIITRFTDYRGRFVFHCHNLEHEDMAMMANFEVL
ncbi:multicopper oxidase family protein [Streptomyces sp. NPDC005969]|uniref:multicopper oxidase family protein n=1 Tax=Streptomyces sp. NPDC005969 TaxID=3156722 RepID=UPI00340CB307